MKKVLYLFGVFILAILVIGCEKVETNNDSRIFKTAYESFNGKETSSGQKMRVVTINEDNPFVIIDGDEVVEKIENKESFYLYVGDPKCPWCRSVIETAIKKANEFEISEIYYIDIWDDDYNEIFRDKYKLNDNNELELVNEGTEAYKKLLTYFDKVLKDYTLTDSEGNKAQVGEKRIYAPNYFFVDKGVVKLMVTGISEKQTDAYQEFSPEIKTDEEKAFEDFFASSLSCDDMC